MAIAIKSVSVKNLGPISEKSFDFGPFNLIYGRNEMGKTFLTEFLIASLFKDASQWALRDLSDHGRVVVSGLPNGINEFSPSSKKKLEDIWKNTNNNYPVNLARWLIVRGGQPAISPEAIGGVGRTELKQMVSNDAKIDQILNRISSTIRSSQIVEGDIQGNKTGEIRKRNNDVIDWQKKLTLLQRVNTSLSTSELRDLERQKGKIQSSLAEQLEAKKYKAFQLDKLIQAKVLESEAIKDDDINEVRDQLRHLERTLVSLEKSNKELEEKSSACKNLDWLREAESHWDISVPENTKRVGWTLPIISFILVFIGYLISSSGSLIFKNSVNQSLTIVFIAIGILFLFSGTGLSIFWARRIQNWVTHLNTSEERDEIREGFKKRYGHVMHGLTDISEQLEKEKTIDIEINGLRDSINNFESERDNSIRIIENIFVDYKGGTDLAPKMRPEFLENLVSTKRTLDQEISNNRAELAGLNIGEDDYKQSTNGILFDAIEEETLSLELQKITDKITQLKKSLLELEVDVRTITRDPSGTDWAKLIFNLRKACDNAAEEYKRDTIEILAGIGLTSVLGNLQEQEDNEIKNALRSVEVTSILKNITPNYDSLSMNNKGLSVSGPYGQYGLNLLSTGAREQVQLALRMGIARRITGDEPLFMILDDAFQHSDWIRRERLIDSVIDMAKSGWQMIYLTMDDHIKQLAETKGIIEFKDKFKSFVID